MNLVSISTNANIITLNTRLLELLSYISDGDFKEIYKVNRITIPDQEKLELNKLPPLIKVEYIKNNKTETIDLYLDDSDDEPIYMSTSNINQRFVKVYSTGTDGRIKVTPPIFGLFISMHPSSTNIMIDGRFHAAQILEKKDRLVFTSTMKFIYNEEAFNGKPNIMDNYSIKTLLVLDAVNEICKYNYDIIYDVQPERVSKLSIITHRNYDTGKLEQKAILFA